MKADKRQRLERAGFVVSDVQEFLNLSDAEMTMINVRVALASALRRRRSKDLKVSQATFAERVGSSQSRVAKMEAGDPSVSLDLLIRSLISSGASAEDVGRMISRANRSAVIAHK